MARNLPRVEYDGYEAVKKVAEYIVCLRQKKPAGGYDGANYLKVPDADRVAVRIWALVYY